MAFTQGDLYSDIRAAIGRGTALDATMKARVRQAVRWIERNYTFKYMEKYGQVTLNPNAAFPHVIDPPSSRVKNYQMLRLRKVDGTYSLVKRINPKDIPALVTDTPSGYWLNGVTSIQLDCKPSEALPLEFQWIEFTSWDSSDTFTHWLLDNAEDVIIAQTMMQMAPHTRDPRLRDTYKQDRDEALSTLVGSMIDLEQEDTSDRMLYGEESQP